MAEELTYILGAGASFQSIPIVKTFARRFKEFSKALSAAMNSGHFNFNEVQQLKFLYAKAYELEKELLNHQSFDTYFKKLFHTGQEESISSGKKILNLYFVWEHLNSEEEKSENENFSFWKQARIDKRYDAFIAGLLKPIRNNRTLYCKVNLITWNYDLDLFYSLKNYFDPTITSKEFVEKIQTRNLHEWNIGNQISVINMNGYFWSKEFEKLKKPSESSFITVLREYLNRIVGTDVDYSDSERIKFAWENEEGSSDLNTDVARTFMKKSDRIILIGYTFPLYNRIIDFSYFKKEDLIDKILYIQDPNALEVAKSINGIFELFKNQNPFGDQLTTVKEITNCDSFFIPNEIFTSSDI